MQRTDGTWTTFLTYTVAALLVIAGARRVAAIPVCGGDCDADGRVRVNELVTVVGALVGDDPVAGMNVT